MYRRAEHLMLTVAILLAVGFTLYTFQYPLYQWYMQIDTDFESQPPPPAPDYALGESWAALPSRNDQADTVPPSQSSRDGRVEAQVDVFYVHPTSAVLSRRINAAIDDPITRFITDRGVIAQQASVFNQVGRIYAPRYRQLTMAAQRSRIAGGDREQALALAGGDVLAAFDYYLAHYNQRRPIILASHSQGSLFTPDLIERYFASGKPYEKQFVAAYVIGTELRQSRMQALGMPVCSEAGQTRCLVSWNAVLTDSALADRSRADPDPLVCVNPLSWSTDEKKAGRDLNLGALPMVGPGGLKPLVPKLFDARCGRSGYLEVNDSAQSGFAAVRFEGGSMHTYDYNLFYGNIRENASVRAAAFMQETRPAL